MTWIRQREWPWWQAGLALGLLNMFAFCTANYYLSVSTTFSRAAGMAVSVVAPWVVILPVLGLGVALLRFLDRRGL
jgi:hypothetical protein